MQRARGLTTALNGNGKFKYKRPESVVDFLVVGGGVVGLAIAQRLSQRFPTCSTILVERHSRAGEEISSRNSEVIHAGLYYPPGSLKTKLCLRGRDMLYERADQRFYIENLHKKSLSFGWSPRSMSQPSDQLVLPTELLCGEEARSLEPNLSTDIVAALWSPKTGIIDSHSLMESLEKDIIDSEGGDLAYSTRVVRIDPFQGCNKPIGAPDIDTVADGWVVQTVTGDAEDGDAILAGTLINASGLSSTLFVNAILPKEKRVPFYYARGSYASYTGPGISQVSRLIYPCPETGENAHAFQSLGTHLTFDLQGTVRFGPDIEWITPPTDGDDADAGFWESHLVPDESRIREIHQAVASYLPGVTLQGLKPDFVGIRPKLVPPRAGFQDFVFRSDYSTQVLGKAGRAGVMISLLGIESPGLTSSLAIAEHVVEDILAKNEGAKSIR